MSTLIATLNLNLGNALSVDELAELTGFAAATNQPLERVLFEAARDLAARLRSKSHRKPRKPSQMKGVAA